MTQGASGPQISASFSPSDADFAALFTALERETAPITGPGLPETLALLLHDPQGTVTGGLWGRIVYSWLVIEMLVVPAACRGTGTGTALLQQAEQLARGRGCVGIHLTRLDFQAPGFYERNGFTNFAVQHDVPPGHRCFYMLKRLDQPMPQQATI